MKKISFGYYLSTVLLSISLTSQACLAASSSASSSSDSCPCTALGTCGTIPATSNTGFVTPDPIISSPQVWSFVSEPNLHPMKVAINRFDPGTSPGLIFLAPYAFSSNATYGQPGSLIIDSSGNPIWFRPLSSPNLMNTDFRVQTYKCKRVLTFWQGTLATPPAYTNAPGGSSEPGSCYYILDKSYRVIANVTAQRDYTSDIHEFLITPRNTALILSTKSVPMDLTPFGGPQNGFVQDFAIQEIDIKTKKLIFFWSALDHLPLSDSFEPASDAVQTSNIWDAYHLNSIGLTDDPHDIIVSSRNFWTIIKINKPTGNIIWELGGKHSSFAIEAGGEFSWQHDARFLPDNLISMFDDNSNGSSTPGPFSHGLILKLNFDTMSASVHRTYFHDPNLTIASQGNVQSLKNGNKFIGWGQSAYFSEFRNEGNTTSDPSVNLLYDAQMPGSNFTYRAYKNHWVGKPFYRPSIAVKSDNGLVIVYASWNGSTETAFWEIFAGSKPKKLKKVRTVEKSGFETAIDVNNNGPYFQVRALDSKRKIIGVSKVIKLN